MLDYSDARYFAVYVVKEIQAEYYFDKLPEIEKAHYLKRTKEYYHEKAKAE